MLLALAGLARIGAGGQRVENAAQKYLASRAGPLVRMAVWPVHSGDHRRFPIKTITCRAIKIKFSAVKAATLRVSKIKPTQMLLKPQKNPKKHYCSRGASQAFSFYFKRRHECGVECFGEEAWPPEEGAECRRARFLLASSITCHFEPLLTPANSQISCFI